MRAILPIAVAMLPINAAVYVFDGIITGAADFKFMAGTWWTLYQPAIWPWPSACCLCSASAWLCATIQGAPGSAKAAGLSCCTAAAWLSPPHLKRPHSSFTHLCHCLPCTVAHPPPSCRRHGSGCRYRGRPAAGSGALGTGPARRLVSFACCVAVCCWEWDPWAAAGVAYPEPSLVLCCPIAVPCCSELCSHRMPPPVH